MRSALALVAMFAALAGCKESKQNQPEAEIAQRVVTLAPNLTELVYTVGAGDQLVGVSAWSDFPRAALDLPVVGDAFVVDQEQLALSRPDLLLVWESGTPAHTVEELRNSGYRVATVRTRGLDEIARAMLQIGTLTGHEESAAAAAKSFRQSLQSLRRHYENAEPIRVFYQVSARPLYTVNKEHYVSELIALCGGENIFSDLNDLAPTIDVEAVVDRNPEVMLASTDAGDDAFAEWQRWPDILANRYGNHFLLSADEIGRATTRLLVAGEAMCVALQQARTNRAQDEMR